MLILTLIYTYPKLL